MGFSFFNINKNDDYKGSLVEKYYTKSYSQEGEDILIKRILHSKPNGFFVDIGAYHPIKFSNTYTFYESGWRGINLDARPDSMKEFKVLRPQDINLEIPIYVKRDKLNYYSFAEPALNTFSKEISELRVKDGHAIVSIKELETFPLKEILDKYMPKVEIDFFSIDVEGLEMDILNSNDWTKYSPQLVLIEQLNIPDIESVLHTDVAAFMKEKNYAPYSKLKNTVVYKRK